MNDRTYWITVKHYATPEVIREEIHQTYESVTQLIKESLDSGYVVEVGID